MSALPLKLRTSDLEVAVRERCGNAAQVRESALCCPMSYDHVDLIEPRVPAPLDDAPISACTGGTLRGDPRETKGVDYDVTTDAVPVCKPGSCC